MRLGGLVLLMAMLALAPTGTLAEEPAPGSAARPYWECLIRAVRKFAPKTTLANEAIAAARAGCTAERDALEAGFYAAQIVKGESAYSAQRVANGTMTKIDSMLADGLVREALLAK